MKGQLKAGYRVYSGLKASVMLFVKNSVEMHGTRAGWCRFVCNNLQIGDTEDLHLKHIA